jgi:hypothetical protein
MIKAGWPIALALTIGLVLIFSPGCPPSSGDNPPAGDNSAAGDASSPDGAGTTDSGTTGDGSNGGATDTGTADEGTLKVQMLADFSASALASGQDIPAGCDAAALLQDHPGLAAGLDCDGDGAIVAYITPSVFRIAVKRLTLYNAANEAVALVPDTGRLADAAVIDLTNLVTLADTALPAAHYVRVEVELYYYEMVMPLNNPPADQGLRMYLSDDDFAAEGNLGHHQGDITLVDAGSHELGFAVEAMPWTIADLSPVHVDMVGAGSTDAETGHRRGLFGDEVLWNQDAFVQGPEQDVYLMVLPVDLSLTPTGKILNIVFNIKDSWYYEDYENDGHFAPCGNGQGHPGDACFDGGAWAAIFPTPEVQIQDAPAAP